MNRVGDSEWLMYNEPITSSLYINHSGPPTRFILH